MARLKIDLDAASVAIATRVFGELYEKLDSAEDQDVQIDLLINEIKTHWPAEDIQAFLQPFFVLDLEKPKDTRGNSSNSKGKAVVPLPPVIDLTIVKKEVDDNEPLQLAKSLSPPPAGNTSSVEYWSARRNNESLRKPKTSVPPARRIAFSRAKDIAPPPAKNIALPSAPRASPSNSSAEHSLALQKIDQHHIPPHGRVLRQPNAYPHCANPMIATPFAEKLQVDTYFRLDRQKIMPLWCCQLQLKRIRDPLAEQWGNFTGRYCIIWPQVHDRFKKNNHPLVLSELELVEAFLEWLQKQKVFPARENITDRYQQYVKERAAGILEAHMQLHGENKSGGGGRKHGHGEGNEGNNGDQRRLNNKRRNKSERSTEPGSCGN